MTHARAPSHASIRLTASMARAVMTLSPLARCVQDDDLPTETRWAETAHFLMQKFRAERLAFLTGRGAAYCGVEIAPQPIDRPKGLESRSKNRGTIPYIDPTTDAPFMFATEAWLAPMCARSFSAASAL